MSQLKVKVYDALMSSGKTTRLMNEVAKLSDDVPVIYIAPLLDECHRFAGTVVDEEGHIIKDEYGYYEYEPNHPLVHKMFRHPNTNNKDGTKISSLLSLIQTRENIVSTHSLFRCLTQEVIDELKQAGYVLIIDEVLSVWERYSLHKNTDDYDTEDTSSDKEILKLINVNKLIEVDCNGLMFWQWDKFDAIGTTYEELARLCDTKQLYIVNGKVVYWEYSIQALQSFKEIWIATYMYGYSFMSEYLKMYDAVVTVEKFGYNPSDFKHLVSVVMDKKMNDVGNGMTALSYNAIAIKGYPNETLKNNLFNFFRNKYKSEVGERLWTTYKAKKHVVSGGRFKVDWIAYSTKATNKYKDAKYVAYLCNPRPSTFLVAMLGKRGVLFNQDMWALSEMVQFIWRSAIRDKKEIVLYVPSQRMRQLFLEWLETT